MYEANSRMYYFGLVTGFGKTLVIEETRRN